MRRRSSAPLPKVKNPAKLTPNNVPLISAIVVTYHPDIALLENLRRLLNQVPTVIVVDNGSDGASAETVEAAGKLDGIQLIRNGSNLGIATALNVGIRHALRSNPQWIAVFDQDSSISDRFFAELLRAYDACPPSEKIGMIVPGQWAADAASKAQPHHLAEPLFSFVPAAITSGSLIKAEIFTTVGFYDDALFIDYVDADFCLRLQKHGFKILSATSVVLGHELGTKQTRHLPGIQISFRIHTAWRYYYIMRNRLVLHRRYLASSPWWVLHDFLWMLLELGRIIGLENDRRPKLRAAAHGIRDGWRGQTGRHPEYPPKLR